MEAGGEQDPADRFKSSAEAVQAHVQGIAALQRVQASQEGYTSDPAVQAHRPKLRDNRCVKPNPSDDILFWESTHEDMEQTVPPLQMQPQAW